MERTHIGFFGKTNSGKSSLINALVNQSVSVVSQIPGTTTDTVLKNIELRGVGACVLMDTPGFDDESILGQARVEATTKTADKTDIAIIVCAGGDYQLEKKWKDIFDKKKTPLVFVLNKIDKIERPEDEEARINNIFNTQCVKTSAILSKGMDALKEKLKEAAAGAESGRDITENVVDKASHVMLVMPQDAEAPKRRLILPQVQTIRELLDKKCVVTCVEPGEMEAAIANMKKAPDIIITDSNVFDEVYRKKPESSRITSFSILYAAYKGDIAYYVESTKAFEKLTDSSRVLIAECCSHAPLDEDIGRVKIPALLRKKYGEGIRVDVMGGSDFPKDPAKYDLIIQCGGCMFNRKHVMSRIEKAREAKVPMTNYGVTIAYLKGILESVDISYSG